MWLPYWSVHGWLIVVSQPVPLTEGLVCVHWPVIAWKLSAAGRFSWQGVKVSQSPGRCHDICQTGGSGWLLLCVVSWGHTGQFHYKYFLAGLTA